MGSVSSLNPGVSGLLQSLSNLNSPVLSSKAAVSALEKAPSADIVQLNAAVNQLENVDAIFGVSDSASSGPSNLLTALENGSTNALSTASPSEQNAGYESAVQAQVTQGLFGTATSNALSGSLFNVIG
jgi:hypothetical protein